MLDARKEVLGISCTIVKRMVLPGGYPSEISYSFFAQDTTGAVWCFGEDRNFSSGGVVVSKEGSWEAGVDGAKPGVIIPSVPHIGQVYRQEYLACVAEDMSEVLDVDASVTVPHGPYTGCLCTHEYTPLDSRINMTRYYARGVGLVLTVNETAGIREELVEALASPCP